MTHYIIEAILTAAIIYLFIKLKNIMLTLNDLPAKIQELTDNQTKISQLTDQNTAELKALKLGVLPESIESALHNLKSLQEIHIHYLENAANPEAAE